MTKAFVVMLCLASAALTTADDLPLVKGKPSSAVVTFDALNYNYAPTIPQPKPPSGHRRKLLQTSEIASVLGPGTTNTSSTIAALGAAFGYNLSATFKAELAATTGKAGRRLLAPQAPIPVTIGAKKSLVTDFAVFAVDFSNSDMTLFLSLASTTQVSMGNEIATTSAAYFVIAPKETPTADAYAVVSESFFLDANQNGKLMKLGLSTSSFQLSPTSFALAIEYDYFANGVLMGTGYLVYSPASLAIEKDGLPTAKSIINTLD